MPLFLFLLFFLSAAQNVDGMGQSGVAILDHMEVMHGEKRSNESDFLKISFHQPIIHPEPSCSSLVTCSCLLLLMHKNIIKFSLLTLYLTNLLNSLIRGYFTFSTWHLLIMMISFLLSIPYSFILLYFTWLLFIIRSFSQVLFQNGCPILHSHQQCVWLPLAPCLCLHMV